MMIHLRAFLNYSFSLKLQLRQRTIKQDMAVLAQGLHGICNGKTPTPIRQRRPGKYMDTVREEAYHRVMEYAEECGLEMNGHLTAQQIETLVHGIMTPPQLLDLIKNYIITEEEIASIKKIVPRYMQYRAADRAVERLLDPPEQEPWAGEGVDPLYLAHSRFGKKPHNGMDSTKNAKHGVFQRLENRLCNRSFQSRRTA